MKITDNSASTQVLGAQTKPQASKSAGFSLVEVMIATLVFSIVSLGLLSAILQSRRLAENLVHDNISLSLAQGYLEQLRTLGYPELLVASSDSTHPLLVNQTTINSGILTVESDTIYAGVVNTREISIDLTEDGNQAKKTMAVTITPTITQISSVSNLDAVLIVLAYTYEVDAMVGMKTKTSELRTVIAMLD